MFLHLRTTASTDRERCHFPHNLKSLNEDYRNERTSLTKGVEIPRKAGVYSVYGLLAIFVILFLAQNAGLVRCPLNDVPAAEKAALRRQWGTEWEAHQTESARWTRERREHTAELRVWEHERVVHREEREGWLAQRKNDEETWRQQQEVARDAFEGEHREEEAERQAARDAWKEEGEAEERKRQEVRDAFERERADEERHRLEVVRRSQGVYWTEPHGDWRCHAYGTRIYTSYLRDIPGDMNWLEVCDNMPPVVIHGREVSKPSKCERNVSRPHRRIYGVTARDLLISWFQNKGEVTGVWYIDFDEPSCQPYWGNIADKVRATSRTLQRAFADLFVV